MFSLLVQIAWHWHWHWHWHWTRTRIHLHRFAWPLQVFGLRFYFHRSRRSPVIIYLNPSRRAFDWRALSVDIIYILGVQKRRHSIHLWKCCLKSSWRVVLFAFSLFWLSHVCSVLFRIMCYLAEIDFQLAYGFIRSFVWFISVAFSRTVVCLVFFVDCRSLSYRILYNFCFFASTHRTVCFVFAGSCAIAFLWISLSFSNSKRKYCARSGCVL